MSLKSHHDLLFLLGRGGTLVIFRELTRPFISHILLYSFLLKKKKKKSKKAVLIECKKSISNKRCRIISDDRYLNI